MGNQKAIDELNELVIELKERIELLEDANSARKREIQQLKNEIIMIKKSY